MPVISVSMPAELIDRLDTLAERHGYTGRSEVVREGSRVLLTEFEDDRLANQQLAGTVSVFSDFETQPIERQLTALRHEYEGSIASITHSYVGDSCLDVLVLETDCDELATVVGKLRAIDGVQAVEYSLVPLETTGV
ncbi:CopG family ribbon-helix-helix protein [Natrialba sp. SSL1]|uniref:CopG family ribbon-helix-helix protein n=1 Tax=Natrialba sp. SSL1 TaxID=1869245 RepID=UPI0008F8FFC2|nr:CopG family ribbon-helix-helix protein [Natrialba sp. SSL1]OIB57766.1 nickel-responsive regulator [Natrialba sp. SSL1]